MRPFLDGFKPVFLMHECPYDLTADELSRGSAFWRNELRRAEKLWYQVRGDAALQQVADLKSKCRHAISRCQTVSPCSRTIYLPEVAR